MCLVDTVEMYKNYKPISANYFRTSYFQRTKQFQNSNRSCSDNTFIITQIIENHCEFNKGMYVAFIDWKSL